MNAYQSLLDHLQSLDLSRRSPDFLLTWEKTEAELQAVLTVARILRNLHKEGRSTRFFDTGLAVSIFRDQSTRTRFSFASAANALGLTVADLDEEKSQIAHGETVRETANMISFLTEAIGIRDDKFLGAGHTGMVEVAEAVQTGFEEGTLHQRPTLVNLQCDLDHPTQSLSDLSMLVDTFGSLENLKGKKLAMTWAYSPSYGKPLSVPQGVIGLMTRFGMEVTLAYPEGYDLVPEIMDRAQTQARESGGTFTVTHDMDAAFQEADVVYPKSWAPFTIMQERTRLLRAGDTRGLDALETQALAQNAEHQDWECTEEKMALTHNGKALYMHCLPADISGVSCKQGEVAATVFDRYRKATYQQASYKPFIIAAMIVLGRFPDPVAKITDVVGRSQLRY
ncbi:MAG: knotted carbamoyltransferase YgeW [FCB group bacterium]|nr:knotted carbamoyltransferase YgeW [FCB group bacterium]